ncbi:flagellar hook-length control protein FliK [Hyphomonas sp. FCG-A18]|uniref:flagellar hook-length control protein FliK n=1 Tax=Hyphomonas sp. FCG-A18 TaxID=3080019 RepID=UPI002B2ECC81|nr:flagellar hook-length control protein FliK [Hyphomonas sp. FCG-A18]
MITDILDVVAGPKQKSALSPKDDTKAAEDQATFADQLAANDRSDQDTKKTEPSSATDVSREDAPVTSDIKLDAQTIANSDIASANEDSDVSFQLFSQTVSDDATKTSPQAAESLPIEADTLTPSVQPGDASKQTIAAADDKVTPTPTVTVTAEEAADTTTAKVAAEQPALAAAVATQAQTAEGETDVAKPAEPSGIGKTAEIDLPAKTVAPQTAAASTDGIAQTPTLATGTASFDEAIKVSATPINATTVGEATGTGVITATTQAPPTTSSAPTVQVAQTPATVPTPPQVVASPEDIPRLITQAMTADDAADRIVIQLDPPELGRVSVDFKLDANGVQTVTVTAETPEAIKKLRMMNFELIQAMEQNGLNSGGFGLDYQQSQQFTQYDPSQIFGEGGSETQGTDSVIRLSETALYHNPQAGQTGLNLKL